FLSTARCAGGAGALRTSAMIGWELLCRLRVAQEGMARRDSHVRRMHQELLPSARCAASYGASRTFIVHHAR
ncbi:hypothetical protein A2U01_0064921, partial [Trifolium medium]|nr:hypothetical protein [Trifolium medium]